MSNRQTLGTAAAGAPPSGDAPGSAGHPSLGRQRRSVSGWLEICALPLAWLLVIVVFSILKPDTFLTVANFSNIFGSYSVPFILTLSLVLPLTCGDYDLSVASVAAMSAMTTAILNVNHHWAIIPAIIGGLVVSALLGLINGSIVIFFEVDSLIVTLGTSTVLQGVLLWISGSTTISGLSPNLVRSVIGTKLLGIPLSFFYGLIICVALWYVLQHTALGKRLLFVGRGRTVAKLSGLRVSRLRLGSFIMSAVLAGVAGIVYAGITGSADPTSALSFLLPAFAAVFLGATGVIPGRFNAWGSLIAVYFLATGITGLQLAGAASYVQQLFYGGALVVAVTFAQLSRRRETRVEDTAR
jgi:ribose transport system permease protein